MMRARAHSSYLLHSRALLNPIILLIEMSTESYELVFDSSFEMNFGVQHARRTLWNHRLPIEGGEYRLKQKGKKNTTSSTLKIDRQPPRLSKEKKTALHAIGITQAGPEKKKETWVITKNEEEEKNESERSSTFYEVISPVVVIIVYVSEKQVVSQIEFSFHL